MKKALALLTVVSVLAAGGAALAGDGFSCQNECPLAQKANEHRSYGSEGSAARQVALAAQVVKGLAKV